MSSTAAMNAASFAFDGLLKPLIFLTNCSDAARISSSVTGGSKLNSILMFRHINIGYREGGHREQGQRLRQKLEAGLFARSQLLGPTNSQVVMLVQEFGGF